MELTQTQLNFFDAFGYLVIPKLFSSKEVDQIISGFEWSIQKHGSGEEHDGSNRTMFGGPIEHRSDMCAILDHPSIQGLIGGILGTDFNYCGGDGNYYTGDTHWHPDGNWGQLFATKIAFYLDELTVETGAIRLIPGSHRPDHFIRQQQIDVNDSMNSFGVPPVDFPGSIAIESEPGDIVIFNHDLYHASYGGGKRRRMFTMNCTRHVRTDEDLETFRQYISVHSPGGYNIKTGAGMFYPTMIDTGDKKRMKHLWQPIQIHDQLFPHLARK